MDPTILATSISPEQKDKQPKSVIKDFPEQFSSTRQESTNLVQFDFELFNADKKVSSLDQFLSYMNEEVIFDSSPGIGNVIGSVVVRAVSYLHSRDIAHKTNQRSSIQFPL